MKKSAWAIPLRLAMKAHMSSMDTSQKRGAVGRVPICMGVGAVAMVSGMGSGRQ